MVYSPFAPETALPMTVPFLSSTLTRSPWTGFRSLLRTVPATVAQYAVVAASARLKPISDAIILLTIQIPPANSSQLIRQQFDFDTSSLNLESLTPFACAHVADSLARLRLRSAWCQLLLNNDSLNHEFGTEAEAGSEYQVKTENLRSQNLKADGCAVARRQNKVTFPKQ